MREKTLDALHIWVATWRMHIAHKSVHDTALCCQGRRVIAWRSRGPQHINETHIFHMQKYQTISHTAGSLAQCKRPLYLIAEPSRTCVSKMCVTPYPLFSSLLLQFKGPAWHLVCLHCVLVFLLFFCLKKIKQ